MNVVHPDTGFNWQQPVITEQLASSQAILLDIDDYTYLSVPWASIIDVKNTSNTDYKLNALKAFNKLKELPKKPYITVCQHYRYREMLDLLQELGVKHLYTPHAEKNIKYDIKIHAFPLYATNPPAILKDRSILYSFVGAYMDHYMSDIRLKIFNDKNHDKSSIIISRDKWQYNDVVYMEQIWHQDTPLHKKYISEQNRQFYIKALAASRYSLCPSGAGPNSIRLFESLACGAIPIIFSDKLELPKVSDINWEECVIRIPESKYNTFRSCIAKITPAKERHMREKCIQMYKLLSNDNFTRCIAQQHQ